MEITVNVPEELAAQAKARGLQIETYVQELLEHQAAVASMRVSPPRTPEDVQAWLDSLAQFSDEIPPLPPVITREWIYQDHD